jgi:hypothetical protein
MKTDFLGKVEHDGRGVREALTLTLSWRERGQSALARRAKGPWLALALFLTGTTLASSAAAQDDDSQGSWRARAATRQYPDDEQPVRKVAMTEDSPALAPPPPLNIDSPSNVPVKKARPKLAGEATDASAADGQQETVPVPRGTRNRQAGVSRGDATTGAGGGVDYRSHPAAAEGELYGDEADCGDDEFGACVPNMRAALQNHVWVRGEALMWWLKGGQTPALITTSPASTPLAQAGVLGQPTTSVLIGDQEMNDGLHAGGRITFGTWLGSCQESGVEFSYMIIGQNTENLTASGADTPVLARPFFDTTLGAESSQVISYPNAWVGNGSVISTENLEGAEALWRQALVHGSDGRIDLLMGYRFARLNDGLLISDTATSSGSAAISPGTQFEYADSFHTRNDFNGADLGFSTEWHRGRLSMVTLLKVGIGETHTEVDIDGSTAITTGAGRNVYGGGILALASNSGAHLSDQFSMMPEIGCTLSYDLTPHLTASVGYTLLYWSDVARPGDQIDLNVDSSQFPSGGNPTPAATVKPAFVLHTSDFWAQGVNVGLGYRF